ncbi:FAD-dependent oxidoreductase [Candidatus Gracilibacteria bacterium]|nr:FAD-dependent oxidoreductase [Candidatus Gracilibacteria bacterium]
MKHYPLIIIGTGSAGLPAGMYASRYGIRNLIIGAQPGGALATSHCVENYPGTLSESGGDIMKRFEEHAKVSGSEVSYDTVVAIEELPEKILQVTTARKEVYTCDFIIYATGNAYRHLDVPGEDRLLGAGVSYCATCDGNFFRNKDVIVVGGGDSSFTEALYLAHLCKTVKILVRKDKPKAEEIWVKKVQEEPNMEIIYNTEVAEINGQFMIESVTTKDGRVIPTQGIFIAVGSVPSIALIQNLGIEIDEEGCIKIDQHQKSTHERIYAAGDVTTGSAKFRQTIMSAAEGCLAAHSVHEAMLKQGIKMQ